MGRTWRDSARPIIAKVIEEVGTSNEKTLREALRKAYPFGPRKYHPYKIWLDEIKSQLGTKRRKPDPKKQPLPDQKSLFS